jgi:hypothetical protein
MSSVERSKMRETAATKAGSNIMEAERSGKRATPAQPARRKTSAAAGTAARRSGTRGRPRKSDI